MPLYNASGKIDGIIGVSIDITEKKQLERALEAKNTELEGVLSKYRDFIANQEHDI
jgi:signal transduction histidine kinase